jgi:hypothetical protein
MPHTEAKTGRAELQKWADDVCLEVARLNQFHEREQMANQVDKPSTFATRDSAPSPPASSAPERSREIEGNRGPNHGMSHSPSVHLEADSIGEPARVRQDSSYFESVRTSQGRLSKL